MKIRTLVVAGAGLVALGIPSTATPHALADITLVPDQGDQTAETAPVAPTALPQFGSSLYGPFLIPPGAQIAPGGSSACGAPPLGLCARQPMHQ